MSLTIPGTHRISLGIGIALALTCVGAGCRAFAEEPIRTETVTFQDLNLQNSEGARALYTRIRIAARHVCAQIDPRMQLAVAACASKAEAAAVSKVNLPQLTAYYSQRTKSGDRPTLIAAR